MCFRWEVSVRGRVGSGVESAVSGYGIFAGHDVEFEVLLCDGGEASFVAHWIGEVRNYNN